MFSMELDQKDLTKNLYIFQNLSSNKTFECEANTLEEAWTLLKWEHPLTMEDWSYASCLKSHDRV